MSDMKNTVLEYLDDSGKSLYADWLKNLRDKKAKAKIMMRVDKMELGLFGDVEPIGDGLSELRLHYGPGYRVYYGKEGQQIYLLCVGEINLHSRKILKKLKNVGQTTIGERKMTRNVRQTHNELLRDPEVAAEYLSEAFEDGDPSVILMVLRNIAEAQEDGISGLAARSHLGRESMYKMLSSTGNPKLTSFTQVIHGLGLKLKVEPDTGNATA